MTKGERLTTGVQSPPQLPPNLKPHWVGGGGGVVRTHLDGTSLVEKCPSASVMIATITTTLFLLSGKYSTQGASSFQRSVLWYTVFIQQFVLKAKFGG